MRLLLFILLSFTPSLVLGQELSCCKNTDEVKKGLEGLWQSDTFEEKRVFEYVLTDQELAFRAFELLEGNERKQIDDKNVKVTIFQTSKGFEIAYNYPFGLGPRFFIKYLDTKKLILMREDGKTQTLVKY